MTKKKTIKRRKKVRKARTPNDEAVPAEHPIVVEERFIHREEVAAQVFVALVHSHTTPPPRNVLSIDDAKKLAMFSVASTDILIKELRGSEPKD